MPKIRFKRGLEPNLPTLDEGEPGFTTDTEKFFIGSAIGNIQFAKQSDVSTNTANIATNTANIASNKAQLDAIGTINANAELVAARGTYPTLAPRLDAADSSLTSLVSKKIYAKDHGVKLDGVTDDTAALNSFFALFGTGVELVVDNGVALVTGQLNLPGQWNPSSNNGLRKLTFNNASINYQGLAGKCCLQIYNHQKSLIDGLSILKGSQDTYINIVGFWYSKLINFEVPRIRFNYNTTDITATLQTADSYTSVFERGITYHGSEFYGVGQTGGGNINSITFNDVKWQGNQVTPNAQYNLKFYGTSFQNFAFNNCDLSYATIANAYIDVAQASSMRLNFYACYFDSNIPLVPNYDFKGAVFNTFNDELSNNQAFYLKTKNKTAMLSNGNSSIEGGNIVGAGYNLARNGDFAYNQTNQGWFYTGNNTSGGGVGNPVSTFLTNTNTINGNSLQVVFAQTLQYIGVNGVTAPFDGVYTCAFRMRKTAGNGTLQLTWNGIPFTVDLTPFALNEEIVISTNGAGAMFTQGASMGGTLSCTVLPSSLTIEILEVTIVPGTNAGINLPIYPTASVLRTVPYTTPFNISNNTTIQVSGRSKIRFSNTTSVTGTILNYGLYDGQEIWLIHEGPNTSTITFAATGSLIADGSNDVLTGGTARKFVWNNPNSLWYRTS